MFCPYVIQHKSVAKISRNKTSCANKYDFAKFSQIIRCCYYKLYQLGTKGHTQKAIPSDVTLTP